MVGAASAPATSAASARYRTGRPSRAELLDLRMSLLPSLWCETPAAGERGARREGQETLTGVERVGRARHRLDGDPLPAPRGIGGGARGEAGGGGRPRPPKGQSPPPPPPPAPPGGARAPPGPRA